MNFFKKAPYIVEVKPADDAVAESSENECNDYLHKLGKELRERFGIVFNGVRKEWSIEITATEEQVRDLEQDERVKNVILDLEKAPSHGFQKVRPSDEAGPKVYDGGVF